MGLLVRRVSALLKGVPVTCGAATTVAEAARLMTRRSVGSVVVTAEDGRTSPVVGIGPEAVAFDALMEMIRRGIRHLAATVEGRLLGVVSSYDLVLLQGGHPLGLAREIEAGTSLEALAALASRVVPVVRWLVDGGVRAGETGRPSPS